VRSAAPLDRRAASASPGRRDRLPPQSFFLVSAVFHYLGPSLAVLLFARIDVLGVAWLRIASAAAVFALWRRPWRLVLRLDRGSRRALVELGAVLAAMNSLFYLAVARLPLSTVGAIEFLGTVLLAALGARTGRNAAALALTTLGVITITEIRVTAAPLGFAFAFGNCALFMIYVILGHRIANAPAPNAAGERARTRVWAGSDRPKPGFEPVSAGPVSGIDRLAASMLIAAVAATPIGFAGALPAFSHPVLLLAGAGVGLCSSVIPYVTDQLAMARLPRATFALMLALLPLFATIIGAIVLRQVPTSRDLLGIGFVIAGVALHRTPSAK
jgi:inner membrane transporter RhtA